MRWPWVSRKRYDTQTLAFTSAMDSAIDTIIRLRLELVVYRSECHLCLSYIPHTVCEKGAPV